MSVAATLDLLQALVTEHLDRPPEAGISVLPCVHEDADSVEDAELFAAAVRRAGGVFVRCGPTVTNWDFPGPLNAAMARQMTTLCEDRGIVVDITEANNVIRVTVDGSDNLTASSSTLAQVLALLCSGLMETEFIVYSYTTDGLDEDRASALWTAGWVAQQFAPAHVQTMAFIVCGWVNVSQHCNKVEGSARYVVRGNDVIRRQPRRSPDVRIQSLLTSLNQPVVLFLGAGASASARIPQGDVLRDNAISRLTGVPIGSDDLGLSFLRFLQDRPHRFMSDERALTRKQFEQSLTLERVLREEFHQLSGRPRSGSAAYQEIKAYCDNALQRNPPGRSAVHKLAELLPRLVIATVNFDELIEDGMGADHQVVASVADFDGATDLIDNRIRGVAGPTPILKVHGTIADAETMVADIETTRRGLPMPVERALDAIFSPGEPVTWIWVGCSMRDHDLRPWLQRFGADLILEHWVDPLPPQSVARYVSDVRAQEWAKIGHTLQDRQITESSDVFLPLLTNRAQELSQTSAETV